MGDLQCAARIFVARHGAADYESEVLSDAGGWLSPLGRQQSRELAGQVEGERISRVWTSDLSRAVQTGEIVAARTGDAAGTTGDPDPFAATFAAWLGGDLSARIPGGESGLEVVARYEAVLEEVADAHRGESVLLVSHGGVMSMVLPLLADNLAPDHTRDIPLPNCGVVALEADADGWVARSWAGRPLA